MNQIRVGIAIFAVNNDKNGEFLQERTLEAFQKIMRRRTHEKIFYGQRLTDGHWVKHETYVIEDTAHNRTNLTHLYTSILARCANGLDKFGIIFSASGEGYELGFKAGDLPEEAIKSKDGIPNTW